jgi:hypothetical protein
MKGVNLRNLTKTEILYVLSLITSFVLFFLSVGVLAGNGANVVVPYVSLSIAIALSLSTLIVGVIRTQKVSLQQMQANPAMFVQAPVQKPVAVFASVVAPVKNEPIIQKVENNYREQKIEPMNVLITLPENKKQEVVIAHPASETKTEDQKIIKPIEKTPPRINAVKSPASKKRAAKRAKAKGKKRK